jgi:hypothetical protein
MFEYIHSVFKIAYLREKLKISSNKIGWVSICIRNHFLIFNIYYVC